MTQRFDLLGRALLCAAGVIATGPAAAAAGAWKPEKNVEIVVNTAPGSGPDSTARLLQNLLHERKLVEAPMTVVNRPAGGGAVAYTYLQQRRGDAQVLAMASKSLLAGHITGRSALNYTDLTPIAILFEEYIAVAVKADSPIKSGKELLERMKKDPTSLSFGVSSSLGNANHQAVASPLKAVGVDLRKTKNVVFPSGANSITALLGGHVDAASGSVGLMKPHLESGAIRLVAIAAPKRLTGLFASTPTWKEQGADVVVSNWRGMVAPPGMTTEQLGFWDAALRGAVQTEAWKKELESNHWSDEYTPSREARAYLDADYKELKAFLQEIDLAKK